MQKVRLKDVAERAGVAVNTASTILNRRANSWASKETEERVFRAAADLGYRPNRAAQALRFGRFSSLALLIPDLNNPFHTAFADLFEEAAGRRGYDVIFETWRNQLERERRLLDEMGNLQVDGVAAFLSHPAAHIEHLAGKAAQGTPFVVISSTGEAALPVDSVLADFERGLREAIATLLELGHRRFALLCPLAEGQSPGGRPDLFRTLLAEKGAPPAECEVVRCRHTIASAYAAATGLLARPADRRPTALIALGDLAAIGALRAAAEKELAVPRDVSIVGADDIPLASFLPVSLSTIAQPIAEMARCAIDLLADRIENAAAGARSIHEVLPTTFIRRESVGPAP